MYAKSFEIKWIVEFFTATRCKHPNHDRSEADNFAKTGKMKKDTNARVAGRSDKVKRAGVNGTRGPMLGTAHYIKKKLNYTVKE